MAKVFSGWEMYFCDNVSSMEEILGAVYSLTGVLKVHSELKFFTTAPPGKPLRAAYCIKKKNEEREVNQQVVRL